MFCPKCRQEISDGTKFCSNCGARIGTGPEAGHDIPMTSGDGDPMTFKKAIITCFTKFFDFNGRASRPEFWWFYLFTVLLNWGLMVLDSTQILSLLVNIAILFPFLSVGSRRLHDTNRSGWWQLISLTIIGLIPLIFWLASKSSDQENKHGRPV
jgi:uncharacterized membrane protein YhaH (DUF805 family)